MERPRRPRPRLEFLELESQLDPDFEAKAWHQFIDFLNHGTLPTESYGDQFVLLERIKRAHARRDRYNGKRRQKRLSELQAQFDPKIAGYLALERATGLDLYGMHGSSAKGEGYRALGAVMGTDRRLTKRFLRESAVLHQLMKSPGRPWKVDQVTRPGETVQAPPRDGTFEKLLEATPVPDVSEAIAFEISENTNLAIDEHQLPATARAAQTSS